MAGALDETIPGFTVPVHRALTEHILLGGAPRSVAILNGTVAAALGLGLRLWLVGIGIGATVAGLGLHDLLGQLEIDPGAAPDAPVHFGGPVETQRGFVLHTADWGGQDTIDVAGLWALSGTIDVLKAIAAGTGPSRWLVALGYAGWGPGQLDEEMTRHGWFSTAAGPELIFAHDAQSRWTTAFADAGIDPRCPAGAVTLRVHSWWVLGSGRVLSNAVASKFISAGVAA